MWHPAGLPLAFINYEREYEMYIYNGLRDPMGITVGECSVPCINQLNHKKSPHWIIPIIHTQLTV